MCQMLDSSFHRRILRLRRRHKEIPSILYKVSGVVKSLTNMKPDAIALALFWLPIAQVAEVFCSILSF